MFSVQDIVTEHSRTLHATYLKRYSDKELVVNESLRQFAAHGGLGYDIEVIMGHRRRGTAWELLIKWAGYEDSSWEPLTRLAKDIPVMVRKYINGVVDKKERTSMQEFVAKLARK